MNSKLVTSLVICMIVAGFICYIVSSVSDVSEETDHYMSQTIDRDSVSKVSEDSPLRELGAYCMELVPSHTGAVLLKNSETHRIPYVALGHRWDPEHIGYSVLEQGTSYTLFFNEELTEDSIIIINWRG